MSSHRPSFVTALVAGSILGVAPAASAVPNAVEFQLDADVILELVEERAQFVEPGCPEIFDAGLSGLHEAIVDHVVFGSPILMKEEQATQIQFQSGTVTAARPKIRMPLDLHLKSVDCVNDPSCPADDTLSVQVFLSFALTADTQQICATFTHSEGVFVPQEALDEVDAVVANFGPMCAPLELGAVTGFLDGATIADVGLSANTALDRIAVRLDMDTTDGAAGSTLGNWQSFMGGVIADAGTEDFSVHMDEAMLRHSFEQQLVDGIECDPSDPESDTCNDEIEPDGPPASLWNPLVPEMFIGLDTDVEVPLCLDISTYVSLDAPLSLSADGTAIEVDGYLDWDPNDGEIFACTFFNPIYAFTLPVPAFFGIMESMAANYDVANQIDDDLPAECHTVGEHGIDCTFPFELPELDLGPGPDGILSATNLRGTLNGLVLEGDVAIVGARRDPEPLSLDGEKPTYGVHGSECDASIGYQGWLDVLGGPGTYCPAPDSGLQSPIVVGDTWGVYHLSDVDAGPEDGIGIGLGSADIDQFWDDPYGLVATVWTTVGSASIALDKPVEHTGIDWNVIADYINAYVLCHFTEQTGLFGIPGKFDFHWLVDPPPYELVAIGTQWDRADAVLVRASVVQVGESYFDERSRLQILPSKSAMLETTWAVDGGRAGRFEFTTQTPMTTDLGGVPVFEGYAYTFGERTSLKVDVPRASLPRGLREASVSVTLDPANVVVTGLEMRR